MTVQRSYPVTTEPPFLRRLRHTLNVMKRAHADGGNRWMSIWTEDIQAVEEAITALSSDGGVESGHATASGSGPLPEPLVPGEACSAIEPPNRAAETVGRHQELKRTAGVTPGPSDPSHVMLELRHAFDGDNVVVKNLILRKAFGCIKGLLDLAQGAPVPVQAAGFAELADIITKIDILLARTDETAGYAAFVKMRQAWPKLRVAALRGCNDETTSSVPSTKSGGAA